MRWILEKKNDEREKITFLCIRILAWYIGYLRWRVLLSFPRRRRGEDGRITVITKREKRRRMNAARHPPSWMRAAAGSSSDVFIERFLTQISKIRARAHSHAMGELEENEREREHYTSEIIYMEPFTIVDDDELGTASDGEERRAVGGSGFRPRRLLRRVDLSMRSRRFFR